MDFRVTMNEERRYTNHSSIKHINSPEDLWAEFKRLKMPRSEYFADADVNVLGLSYQPAFIGEKIDIKYLFEGTNNIMQNIKWAKSKDMITFSGLKLSKNGAMQMMLEVYTEKVFDANFISVKS
jgi:hypothetical protein